jgi:hypothetical protein
MATVPQFTLEAERLLRAPGLFIGANVLICGRR